VAAQLLLSLSQKSLGDAKTAQIIRSDHEHEEIAAYIANNPAAWLTDAEHPSLENQSPHSQ